MNPEIPPSSLLEQELLKRNQQLEEKMARLEKENQILRELRRLDLIKKYGAGSERRIWSESNKSSYAHPSSAFAGFAVKKSRSSDTKPVKYSMSNRPNTSCR